MPLAEDKEVKQIPRECGPTKDGYARIRIVLAKWFYLRHPGGRLMVILKSIEGQTLLAPRTLNLLVNHSTY